MIINTVIGRLFVAALAGFASQGVAQSQEADDLRSLAASGDAQAMYALAERHEQGDGVVQDLARASSLYELAALRGHPEAQYRLGLAYFIGIGLDEDLGRAYGWLNQATGAETQSALIAQGLIERLDTLLSDEQRLSSLVSPASYQSETVPLDEADLEFLQPIEVVGPAAVPELVMSPDGRSQTSPENQANVVPGPTEDLNALLPADPALCGGHSRKVADAYPAVIGLMTDAGVLQASTTAAVEIVVVNKVICHMIGLLNDVSVVDGELDLALLNQDFKITEIFQDGDFLVLDAAGGDPSKLVYVDYLIHDGDVVHLFPDDIFVENEMPASKRMRIGDPVHGPKWQITPPFGNDLVVVYASDEPMFSEKRSFVEEAGSYFPELRARLLELSRAGKVKVDYHVIQTAAR